MLRIALLIGALFVAAPHVHQVFNEPQAFGDHYVSGQLRLLRHAKRAPDGQLVNHGTYTLYYEGGQKELEGEYVEGVREGPWHWFYENGRRKAECQYRDGQGVYTAYYEDGRLLQKGAYRDDQRTGSWVEYFESGSKAIEGDYVDDQQHGWWTYWRDGEAPPAMRIRWERGERVEG